MSTCRMLAALLLFSAGSIPAGVLATPATEETDDRKMVGSVLAIVQQVVHEAASSPDPQAAQKNVDAILAGKNTAANRVATEMLEKAMQDMPEAQRSALAAIGRDLIILLRREQARVAAELAANPPRNLPPAR